MTNIVPIAIVGFGAIAIFLIVVSMVPTTNVLTRRMRRLEGITEPSLSQRSVMIDQIVSEEHKSTIQSRLNEGGWYEITPAVLLLRGLAGFGIGFCFGLLIIVALHNAVLGTIIAFALGLVGWRIPSMILSRAIKARKDLISRDLPEFLDLLSTTVQAGLSLNAALVQSSEAATGPLKAELSTTLSEIRLGRSRADALNSMADRINEKSVTMAVSAIVQAEKLGVDLAGVLQELARESRDRRWTNAEEKAAQLPIKMIVPMALLMIPSLYLMIFGPVIAEFVEHR